MKKIFFLVSAGVALIALGWFGGQEPLDPLRAAEQAYATGQYALALRLYDESVAVEDPRHALFNRGEVLYKLGKVDRAARDFRTSISPDNAERSARAWYDLGNSTLRLACRSKQSQKADLLRDAIACYEVCLTHPGTTDEQLLDNARYNQELAKKLLQQSDAGSGKQQLAKKDEQECEH